MAENVRVVVRCRPMNRKEVAAKCRNIIDIEDCVVTVLNPIDLDVPAKSFAYDSVYNECAQTETIYNDVCYALVENVLEGYNGTIFAYGQTGCGKTHTMQGPNQLVTHEDCGIIKRSFDHIFDAISVTHNVRYLALVSYLEIYNECIRDLLNPGEAQHVNHALKEVPGIGVTVPTVSSHTVVNANECHRLLDMGNQNRVVGATLMNETSSRSHSIFTISLEQIQEASPGEQHAGDKVATFSGIRRGKLNLVDLAGSERQNKTGAAGDRLKEATKINLSLSALGNVISALVDGKTKHVPYRDSKLTRLLQDSLGGNTKTLMISCISPANASYDETLSTLRYAARAKLIANKPKINEDPKDAKLREYQEEIVKLKQLLNESQHKEGPEVFDNTTQHETDKSIWLATERNKLRQEMAEEMRLLKAEHVKEQTEREEQLRDIANMRELYESQLSALASSGPQQQVVAIGAAVGAAGAAGAADAGERDEQLQFQARSRIEEIKRALIGGERANDLQLKNALKKRKIDAQRRLSALAHVLSRVQQSEDRNLLQVHYTSIQAELNAKNEYLKTYRQKLKALEREVSDLQSEFQLDRTDYLESIRRLERSLKFYQQLLNKALPILRKDGKYWEPQEILEHSTWNDDFKVWKLPESNLYSFRLPPANSKQSSAYSMFAGKGADKVNQDLAEGRGLRKLHTSHVESTTKAAVGTEEDSDEAAATAAKTQSEVIKVDILNNYFRTNRQKPLGFVRQTHGFQAWKDFTQRSKMSTHGKANDPNDDNATKEGTARGSSKSNFSSVAVVPMATDESLAINRTWAGGGFEKILAKPANLAKHYDLNAGTVNFRQQP